MQQWNRSLGEGVNTMFEAEFVCENVSQTIDKKWICSAADSHPKLMLGPKKSVISGVVVQGRLNDQ